MKSGIFSEVFRKGVMSAVLNRPGVQCYEFGKFRLILEERLLLRGTDQIALPPKVFDALVLLIENEGHLVEKNFLLDRLWPDAFVEEATLARTISSLRKILGESAEDKFIETVSKRGYRFVAPVRRLPENASIFQPGHESAHDTDAKAFVKAVSKPDIRPVGIAMSPGRKLVLRPVLLITLLILSTIAVVLLLSWNQQANKAKEMKSIAVLPFSRIGDGEHDETLEFGMADTLITRLSNLKRVIVRPTSAVSKYTGQRPDAIAVGRELQVDAVLEGSIQKSSERVRVNVLLISTADGSPLWAEKFDTAFTNIFAIQDSISEQVVNALTPQLNGDERQVAVKRSTENTEAYQLYLQGRYFWNKRTARSLKKSIEYFEQAIAKDPEYALAYTGLADCHQLLAEYFAATPEEGFTKARDAAKKALVIDDELAEAHTSLAYTLAFYDWNWAGAEKEFKRALELDPNYATAHQWYGEFLVAMGRFDEAKIEHEKALELDPTSLIIHIDLASYYYTSRQFDEAIKWSQKVIEMDPDFAYGYVFLSFSLGQKGMKQEAAEAYIKSVELFGEPQEAQELRGVLSKEGIKAMWLKRIEQVDPSRRESFSALWRALLYGWAGDSQGALDWLDKAFERRDRWIVNSKYSPEMDIHRSDPRFQDLLRRIGL